jgi:exoribonuclease-2
VVRENDRKLTLSDASGREKMISSDLVMMRYSDHRASAANLGDVLSDLEAERSGLQAELDLYLLWEVVHEQARSFTAPELAELFFGRRSQAAVSVMLEALLNDRLYFVRRHMDFIARSPDQVERLRLQAERVRMRSEEFREVQSLMRQVLAGDYSEPAPEQAAAIAARLKPYVENPFTRSRETTTLLEQAAPDIEPVEAAYEILDRLDQAPSVPRFAAIGGLRIEFPGDVLAEARAERPPERPLVEAGFTLTIDDEDTVEIDDALSCEELPGGGFRARIHIALVADFVAKDGAMDREAAERVTSVYLPETTVRMLPDEVSCDAASLVAEKRRPVLTTEVVLSADGEIRETSIYPGSISIGQRLTYDEADRIIADGGNDGDSAPTLRLLNAAAGRLRERRRRAGALLVQRRETKVKVHNDEIEVRMIDASAPSRTLVGEFMILSNFVAARYAADNRIPIIYRVQPRTGGELPTQRPRLSLYPEYHAGIGLDCYAQVSSPIRRYADLVLQRQLVAALSGAASSGSVYSPDELLKVLAGAESAEAERRELERRAKRYWILRYLERDARDAELKAYAFRDGATAELVDYGVRGTLHGAPTLANQYPLAVQITRVDPIRGWLVMNYLRPRPEATEGAP